MQYILQIAQSEKDKPKLIAEVVFCLRPHSCQKLLQ